MHETSTKINCNFNNAENESVETLIAHSQSLQPRFSRKRSSCLEPYLPEIVAKYHDGCSYKQIANQYIKVCGRLTLNKSTVSRAIEKYLNVSK